MDELSAEDSFRWQLTINTDFSIKALDNGDQPIPGVRFDIYKAGESGDELLFSGITGDDGIFSSMHPLPREINEVIVRTNFIGLPNEVVANVSNGKVNCIVGGKQMMLKSAAEEVSVVNTAFSYLGTYNSLGVPNYLEPVNDPITPGFLQNVNTALPEYRPVPQYHPEYLMPSNETNLVLLEDADVWITFVHEGAGYRNALGFYTYQYGNPPASASDIDTITIIFPNASFYNSGGGLYSGNKVRLGTFPVNTVIGWVLIANGFQNGQVSSTATRFYSDPEYNPEPNPAYRQHNVLLYDAEYDVVLIGFEDLVRPGGDNDFNDALFYATSNPPSAVNLLNLPPVDPTMRDTDHDGVVDAADDYPNDANKAFNHYYPSESTNGSLSFEDKWPSKGDYDFNDLVLEYNFNQITNASNEIVQIDADLTVKAVGAGYRNGFGFTLPLAPSDIQNVTGQNLQNGIVNLSANNTEAGQAEATIIAFDNAFNLFQDNHVRYINTDESSPYEAPASITISTMLSNPVNILNFDVPPYNAFLIANLDRGKEIHLPDHAPTSLANPAYFGSEDDDSNPSAGKYFKTRANLPWVMHLPEAFSYPVEKKPIITGHLVFSNWVFSGGSAYSDWYKNQPGYRNLTNIYTHN